MANRRSLSLSHYLSHSGTLHPPGLTRSPPSQAPRYYPPPARRPLGRPGTSAGVNTDGRAALSASLCAGGGARVGQRSEATTAAATAARGCASRRDSTAVLSHDCRALGELISRGWERARGELEGGATPRLTYLSIDRGWPVRVRLGVEPLHPGELRAPRARCAMCSPRRPRLRRRPSPTTADDVNQDESLALSVNGLLPWLSYVTLEHEDGLQAFILAAFAYTYHPSPHRRYTCHAPLISYLQSTFFLSLFPGCS
jgi:hypothetical protein